jgi:hypothetical protein
VFWDRYGFRLFSGQSAHVCRGGLAIVAGLWNRWGNNCSKLNPNSFQKGFPSWGTAGKDQ